MSGGDPDGQEHCEVPLPEESRRHCVGHSELGTQELCPNEGAVDLWGKREMVGLRLHPSTARTPHFPTLPHHTLPLPQVSTDSLCMHMYHHTDLRVYCDQNGCGCDKPTRKGAKTPGRGDGGDQ